MNSIKIFCPASVANLSCGFDILGLCLDSVGDEMIITKIEEKKMIKSQLYPNSIHWANRDYSEYRDAS